MEFVYVLILVVLLVLARFLLWKMSGGAGAKTVFWCGLGLFGLYSLLMGGGFWFAAKNAGTVEDCLSRVLVVFLMGNLIVLFSAVLFFCVRSRSEMSELDKMKLKVL